MKSPEIQTLSANHLKRKNDGGENENMDKIPRKTRPKNSAKEAACSPDSTEPTIKPTGKNLEKHRTGKRSPQTCQRIVSSSQRSPDNVSSPTILPGTAEDCAPTNSTSPTGVTTITTHPSPDRIQSISHPENVLNRDMDLGGSLVRLFKQRFPWTSRERSASGSAFREVSKDRASTALSTQHLPLRPRLLNDQMYGRSGFRPKTEKPFAGLSEITVPAEGESSEGGTANPTQPIVQPIQESYRRHPTRAQHTSSGANHIAPETFRVRPYHSLRQNIFQGLTDINSNALKHLQGHARYVENTVLPFGRYLTTSAATGISSPHASYMPLHGLMLTPPVQPIWQPPSLGMLSMPSENWCARCKTSFRMTSDLVYHMRTYHKRENPTTSDGATRGGSGDTVTSGEQQRSGKSNGDGDKTLQCNVCRETFRERHHLTRHMTSHVR